MINRGISAILIILFCLLSLRIGEVFAADNVITISCQDLVCSINNELLGNNLLGHDPSAYRIHMKKYYGNADFGAGIWDSKWNESNSDVIALAKGIGIGALRFPGGCGTHHYDWKKAIGNNREHFLFGIDEFLKVCEEIGAEPIITVSYFTGDENDAADLVEYLNYPNDGSNPNGGTDWAAERAKNGHPEPYNVNYFEIGNEVYHGNHKDIKKVKPEEYVKRFLLYYFSMKHIDPGIKVGAVLHTKEWNRKVLSGVSDKVDFGIVHTYPTIKWGKKLSNYSASEIFTGTFAMPEERYQKEFEEIQKQFFELTGKQIDLAITEFNCGFVQDKPVPYRHTLGCALVNAELLKIFMRPENNILMANYWNFCNEYWGMIANRFKGNYDTFRRPYYKRPNYYVFEMYNKHFGNYLLDTEVESESYTVNLRKYYSDLPAKAEVPYLSVNASTNEAEDRVYLMVINKNLENSETATIDLKDFIPADQINTWVLNGPKIDSTNEGNPNTVKVRHKNYKIDGNQFEFTFEPHSLTAIEISREEGEE